MFEDIFKRQKPNHARLAEYGFESAEGGAVYTAQIMDGEFLLTVFISEGGRIDTTLNESDGGEEYTLYKTNAQGAFVGRVRTEIGKILADIAKNCFDPAVFRSRQADMLISFVREKYGDEPEFLWEKFPDNAIWRRKDNKKWYGAILTVRKDRLGFESDEIAEVVDLRAEPEKLSGLLERENYYPGWHMNKKHWYTIILDGGTDDAELKERIDESYRIAEKRGGK